MKTWHQMVAFCYSAIGHEDTLIKRRADSDMGNVPYDKILMDLTRARVFEIDDTVKRMLLMTKEPELSYEELKLPFSPMFLDITILPEDLDIGKSMESIEGLFICPSHHKDENIEIDFFAVMNVTKNDKHIFMNKTTITTRVKAGGFKIEHQYVNKKEYQAIKRLIFNFILFLRQPDVKTIEIVKSEKNILRKLKRGKIPEPNKVLIKLGGKIKQYIDRVKSMGEFHYSHSFWVRGHWRMLRAERYCEKIGTRRWIAPFIKGEGMLVPKTYEVKESV